jgi:dipeptidase E
VNDRTIVAMGGGGFLMGDPVLDAYVLERVAGSRPKVCFVPTASGDAASAIVTFYDAFPARSFEPSTLRLFDRDVDDIASFLGEQDLVYVGGGNTAILLAAWRVHGVDVALRAAWAAGVVLAGMSAGANCWFEASTTDSFLLGRADPLIDGVGLLPGSFTPHYDGEDARRPSLHALLTAGSLPAGLACDDFAAVRFDGIEPVEAVASRDGAGAYRVDAVDGDVVETPLVTRRVG